ncbi:MAG: serine hydrolase domain-containing protein [Rhodothermales bacterium]
MLLFVRTTRAQFVQPDTENLVELDRRVYAHLEQENIPGGLVAVVSRGKIMHVKSYGLANVELAVPVTDSTVFEIGSISKQFVIAAIMMLAEENKIGLDDKIHQFMPELPSEWLGVTVRHLMSHTSGIPDYEEIRSYDVYRFRMTPEEVIQIAHSRPMDFPPGTGWYYSNTGYFLLSMILERVEEKPIGQVLASRIFQPLGMAQTRFADPEAIIPHRASGYWVNKVGKLINRNATETSSTLGAGGLLTSIHDMAKWDHALYGTQLLSEASKIAMWTPTVLPGGKRIKYAFGWEVGEYKGLSYQSHSGMVAGFVADFERFPDQDISFMVFLNRYDVSAYKLAEAAMHTFMPRLGPIP